MLQVDCKQVVLTGMVQSSTFTLFNSHELLAAIFQLQAQPDLVEIEPKRGIIMNGDKKIIRIRCKGQARPNLPQLQKQSIRLTIKGSYQSEYNHKILIKNNIRDGSAIPKDNQQIVIPLHFNFAQEISKIHSESRKSQSLRNSRQNSFQKFRDSSIKRVKNSKINEDLDFILRNEEFKRHHQLKNRQRSSDKVLKSKTSPQMFQKMNYSPIKDPRNSQSKGINKKNEVQIVKHYVQTAPNEFYSTPIKKVMSKQQTIKPTTYRQGNSNRGFQLVVLAVIAALFIGLGEGIGNIIKN